MIRRLLSRIIPAPSPQTDIFYTYDKTFRKLLKASKDQELLTRSFEMSTALTACGAVLRDVHGLPFEDGSLAMSYMKVVGEGKLDDIEAIDSIFMKALKESVDWPNMRKAHWIARTLHPKHLDKINAESQEQHNS